MAQTQSKYPNNPDQTGRDDENAVAHPKAQAKMYDGGRRSAVGGHIFRGV